MSESNMSGGFLEKVIEDEFRRRGVSVFQYAENRDNGDLFEARMLLKNVPYTSIYGCNSWSEFVYRDFTRSIDVRIECRWQQVGGSVDEKFPYLIQNALAAMPEQNIYLLIDGGGARPQAVDWIRQAASRCQAKTIRALDIPGVRRHIKQLVDTGVP